MLIEVSQLQDHILLVDYQGIYQPFAIYNAIKNYCESKPIRIIIVDIQQMMLSDDGIHHIENVNTNSPIMTIIECLEEYSFILDNNNPLRVTITNLFTQLNVIEKVKFYNSIDDFLCLHV